VINTLCDNALFEGYVARVPMIDEQMIERVARDLGLDGTGGAQPTALKRPVSVPPPAAAEKGKPIDLGEIDRYLAGLAKPS
jgi:general secretion pathway protein A